MLPRAGFVQPECAARERSGGLDGSAPRSTWLGAASTYTTRPVLPNRAKSRRSSPSCASAPRLAHNFPSSASWLPAVRLRPGKRQRTDGLAADVVRRMPAHGSPRVPESEEARTCIPVRRSPSACRHLTRRQRCQCVGPTSFSFLTDSLRVARFEGSRMIWRSPRISWDGIEFDSLIDGRLRGRAWWLGSHESPDSPFEFDFVSGELLIGQIVSE